jgi:hypothetical protein
MLGTENTNHVRVSVRLSLCLQYDRRVGDDEQSGGRETLVIAFDVRATNLVIRKEQGWRDPGSHIATGSVDEMKQIPRARLLHITWPDARRD